MVFFTIRRNSFKWLLVLMAGLSMAACSTPGPTLGPTRSPISTPVLSEDSPLATPPGDPVIPDAPNPPEPHSGKASVSGVAYSYTVKRLVPETLFYLTPASGSDKQVPPLLTGPEPSAGDVQGETGKQGEFVLNDVPPGDYYFVIWAPPYSWSVGEISPQNSTARLIHLGPNDQRSLGTVYLGWP